MVLAAPMAQAAQIVAWDMLGQPGNQLATAATASALNITGLDMTRGAGLGAASGTNSLNSNGWGGTDPTDYITFGFTVGAGYSVALDELIIGTRSSNTGPGTLGLFYSGNSFATALTTWSQIGTDFNNQIIDLSTLTGLTGTVEFRIVEVGDTQADGDGATANGGTFRVVDYYDGVNFIDTQFTGDVLGAAAIPLPAAAWLFGTAVLGLAGFARRRQAA